MSIQTDLRALIGAIVDERAYPVAAPDSPVAPYLTYQRVSAVPQNVMAGNGGAAPLMNTRLQIDVYAATYAEAQAKADAIKAALRGWAIQNVTNSEQDLYEGDVKLHRVMIDISTWHN
jgi:hypothetical protein